MSRLTRQIMITFSTIYLLPSFSRTQSRIDQNKSESEVSSTDCSNYIRSQAYFWFLKLHLFALCAIIANLLVFQMRFNYHLNKRIVMVPLSVLYIHYQYRSVSCLFELYVASVLFGCQCILLHFLISNIDEFALNRRKNNPKTKLNK